MSGLQGFKEAVGQVKELLEPKQVTGDDGLVYYNRELHLPPAEATATPLHLGTLDSLLEYVLKAGEDRGELKQLVHVRSECRVELVSVLHQRARVREALAVAHCEKDQTPVAELAIGGTAFGLESSPHNWGLSPENFNIALRVAFKSGEGDYDQLLETTSRVVASKVRSDATDGVAQEVTVTKGLSGAEWGALPKEVSLVPACSTFPELAQPTRKFILRARAGKNEDEEGRLALIEVMTPWQRACEIQVAHYLSEKLGDAHPVLR